jgi:hypothetical protein
MENKYQNISAIFMITLLLSSIFMLHVPPEAEAQIVPDIDLEMGDPYVNLDVSPRGSGLGSTHVIVYNSAIDATVKVQVQINVPGFAVAPQFATVSVPPSGSKTINIAIAAILRTPYRQVAGDVNAEVTQVNGAPVNGISTAQTGFFVQSQPYGKVILQSDKPFQKVSPGKEYPFKIKVVNNGNGVDTFALEITNKDALQKDGFSISMSSTTTKDTDPQAYDLITVQIQTPREFGWKNDYYNLDVRATSELENQKSDYSLTIWVYGFGIAGFEPLYSIFAISLIASYMAKKRTGKES